MEQLQTIKNKLQDLHDQFTAKGDTERADKIRDLQVKCERRRMDLTFCGHFSAGKSSLINQLCGASILPSSPIPTSANVVMIENGTEQVIVERSAANPLEVTLGQLDEVCRDGTDIKRVNIRYPVPILKDSARLLDTPGVDSTDDLHRKATEDALHMADAVFYVMDYNHVLSEMNFQYIRKLADFGKPLYLIVNQIDKHRDQELKFSAFRKQVERSLDDWNIQVGGLLFVSVKYPGFPHNEWEYLQLLIRKLVDVSDQMIMNGMNRAVQQIIQEHEWWLLDKQQEVRQELEQRAEGEKAAARDGESVEEAEEALSVLERSWSRLSEPAKQDLHNILKNANVIPATSRDIVQAYLESMRSGFRVGLIFSERKTQAEREKRLHALRDEVSAQAEAHILWHVQDYIKKLLDDWELDTERMKLFDELISGLAFPIEEEWLASFVAPGGHFDDSYTLQYAKVIAEEIKQQYRKRLWQALEQFQHLVEPLYEMKREALTQRLTEVRAKFAAQHELVMLDRQLAQYMDGLHNGFFTEDDAELHERGWKNLHDEFHEQLRQYRAEQPEAGQPEPRKLAESLSMGAADAASHGTSFDRDIEPEVRQAAGNVQSKLTAAAARLEQAIEWIDDMPTLSGFVRTLDAKAQRLRQQQYTIALFGAFSAGKSSFANALLHTDVLPVSPNPTTAAINSVLPPVEEEAHGTANLHYKTVQTMQADLKHSLAKLHIPLPEQDGDLLEVIAKADLGKASAGGKVHVAFLQAVQEGWPQYAAKLGTSERVDIAVYQRAVADETHACFLESADLYMNSTFADQGMVLVDTPGADSINARHTGVSFQYIKNADAILFVTYYNHAFSHADREFLRQLGRVKDSFALNKMFFIVNAADLASDEQELEEVVEHVRNNLSAFGLHDPRIYPVSSLMAREAVRSNRRDSWSQSGMPAFEKDFYAFVQEELADMSIRSGESELVKTRDALAEWLQTMRRAEADRDQQTARIKQGLTHAKQLLQEITDARLQDELAKEIQELIYYVAQRVTYRFGELYNLAFNPSTFAEAAMQDKEKLSAAYGELLHYLAFDIEQELRATTLRIETFMERQLTRLHTELSDQLRKSLQGLIMSDMDQEPWSTPACEVKLQERQEEWKTVRSAYRNNRHFFEQGGKDALKQSLDGMLQDRIKQAAHNGGTHLQEHYESALQAAFERMIRSFSLETEKYAEGMLQSLQDSKNLDEIERRLALLHQLTAEQ